MTVQGNNGAKARLIYNRAKAPVGPDTEIDTGHLASL